VRVFAFLIILSLSLHSISLLKILARGQPLLLNRRRRIKVVAPTHEPEAGAVRDKRKVGLSNSARVREETFDSAEHALPPSFLRKRKNHHGYCSRIHHDSPSLARIQIGPRAGATSIGRAVWLNPPQSAFFAAPRFIP
jgi:hypothetical protein